MIIAYLGVDQVTRKQKWTTSRVSKLKEKSKLKKQSYKLKYKTRAFNNETTTYQQVYKLRLEQYMHIFRVQNV